MEGAKENINPCDYNKNYEIPRRQAEEQERRRQAQIRHIMLTAEVISDCYSG